MKYQFFVYIMASPSGTLYIGMTNNLTRRVQEHKSSEIDGFSKKYGCTKLVYFEETQYVYNALSREKELKKWNRKKKEELIKTLNPHWNDLAIELFN
jgi:putative endonuclease